MDLFIPEPRDRLETPICKAIESKDFKQALKLVEKRLTKSQDPYLQALKFFIQCSHPLVIERGKGLAAFLDLSERKEKQYTSDELNLYDEAINAAFPGNRGLESIVICKMRADAVKNDPKDEQLGQSCLRGCLARDNLECAQQIAISLEKNFPSNRSYQFYNITITCLYAKSPMCPAEKSMIYARLAYSKIRSLAAANLKVTDQNIQANRCLQGPQELLLFHRLLEEQDYDEEGVKLLKDDRLGPTSNVAKGLWEFRRKQLQLMGLRKEWADLFDTCHKLLSIARADNKPSTISDTTGGDWSVWTAFLRSVLELRGSNHSAYIREASQELEAHLLDRSGLEKPFRRNAFLAMLEFDFTIAPFSLVEPNKVRLDGITDDISHRLFSLGLYLYRYGNTAIAFSDIKPYIEKLNKRDQNIFMPIISRFLERTAKPLDELVDPSGWRKEFFLPKNIPENSRWEKIILGTTQTKIEYFVKSSVAEMDRAELLKKGKTRGMFIKCRWCSDLSEKSCQSCLQKLCKEALQAYGSAMKDDDKSLRGVLQRTDIHPADDWVIIAAMCLMKLAGCEPWSPQAPQGLSLNVDTQELLQACAILEYAHTHSKANPGTSFLLVKLYSLLGAGSLAIRAFNRLGVKQIQLETLSYLLFDRISSLHPHNVADGTGIPAEISDPSYHMKKLHLFYNNGKRAIETNIWKAFENGSYDSIFQFLEVSDTLSSSMVSAMSVIELRRISRVTKDVIVFERTSHGYPILTEPLSVKYSDNSDYDTFPNYEHSQQAPFEMYTRFTPKLSQIRIHVFLLLEELWTLLSNVHTPQPKRTAAFTRLVDLNDTLGPIDDRILEENFTKPEAQLAVLGLNLISMIRLACDPEKTRLETTPAALEDMIQETSDYLAAIQNSIKSVFELVDDDQVKWIPTFTSTLHPLYSAYEATKMVIASADFLRLQKFHPLERFVAKLGGIEGTAKKLRGMLKITAEAIKERLNDNPWLDFVLQEVRDDETAQNGDSVIQNQRRNSESSVFYADIGTSITQILGSEFLENWAGEVVDSWRDSTRGLAYFK